MKTRFGRHYTADLYLCQNKLWESQDLLETAINRLANNLKDEHISWRFDCLKPSLIRITGDINEYNFMIVQIFPAVNFLGVDIFGWQTQLDLQQFSEELINLFAPQVVAAETKLRAEHLPNHFQLTVEN